VIPGEAAYLRGDLSQAPDDLAVDLLIVLAVESGVIDPGDLALGRVDVGRRGVFCLPDRTI
jgi:hypothetical protein